MVQFFIDINAAGYFIVCVRERYKFLAMRWRLLLELILSEIASIPFGGVSQAATRHVRVVAAYSSLWAKGMDSRHTLQPAK